ncbi:nucleotide sugar dehydrogenase [Pseudonocardia broussonetiae]|uniref:UDP-glucose 6-dehydrogenase n=1 Tax=Pseudonocardia broussonetiae TaxID=2736640 RepID=A0A6M6JJC7_9PSEU|nr:nucleotide sugar dehydrogenase [Pseudonocardia broussonetiae]QJY47027.1 nucleotide sugar dehydrogenase [Pseudonocardia broussonetiae]
MNVTLFGLGYVGSVTATCLASRGHHVVGVDTDPGKVAALNAGVPPVLEAGLDALLVDVVARGALRATDSVRDALADSDVSLICVGTPSAHNGSTDLRQVERVVREIGSVLAGSTRPHTVVVRSTVPPGTVEEVVAPLLEEASGRRIGDDLQVAMCPEFLREGTSVADFFDPPFLVVGGSPGAAAVVRELFGFVRGPVHEVELRSAESLKYACNAFHALKVSFTNELSRLYRLLDVDSREVMEVFVGDRQLNISPAYLRPGFAFGGSCLPKDLRSLLHLARMNCVDLPVLQGALASNEMVVRDVAERVLDAVESGGGQNRRVALLGLSFKHNTDDLRESPNVALAEMMLGKGLDVRIHDPHVNTAMLTGANLRYVHARLPHLQKVLHDDAADALRDAQVVLVSTSDPSVVATVLAAAPPVVIDLDGRLGRSVESLAGYQGVGW